MKFFLCLPPGVLMWEIYSCGSPPYGRLKKNVEVFNHVVNNGARLDRPSCCSRDIYAYMASCWDNVSETAPVTDWCKIRLQISQQNYKVCQLPNCIQSVNTLRPRQNYHHFTDDIFKCIFLNENV